MITIRYKSTLLDYSNIEEESIEAKNIKDVLIHIKKSYGREAYKEARKMLIAVNLISISQYNHFKTELTEGDIVTFFPMCGGG